MRSSLAAHATALTASPAEPTGAAPARRPAASQLGYRGLGAASEPSSLTERATAAQPEVVRSSLEPAPPCPGRGALSSFMPRRPAAEAKAAPPDLACKLVGRNAARAAHDLSGRHCQLVRALSASCATDDLRLLSSRQFTKLHFWVDTFPSRQFLSLARWDVRLVMEGTGLIFLANSDDPHRSRRQTVRADSACADCSRQQPSKRTRPHARNMTQDAAACRHLHPQYPSRP